MDVHIALEQLKVELKAEGAKIVEKSGWFWTVLHYVVLVVTFGGNKRFKTGYITTIGPWIGVPVGFEKRSVLSRYSVLRHELVHVRQCRRVGLGNVYLGMPLFGLTYVFLPFPIGLAWFRWRYERAAYAIGINARLRFDPDDRDRLIDNAVRQLTSGLYGWTATLWPGKKRVRAWFELVVPRRTRSIAI